MEKQKIFIVHKIEGEESLLKVEKEIIYNKTEVKIETDNPLNVIVITKSEAKARVVNPNSV